MKNKIIPLLLAVAVRMAAQAQTPPTIEWQQTFGGAQADGDIQGQRPVAVAQTTDGDYIVGGNSSSIISGNKTDGGFGGGDYWVVKFGVNGKQWDRAFGGIHFDRFTSLQQTSDGGYIVGGESYYDFAMLGNKTHPGFGGPDYWVVKLNANGVKQWDQSYGGTGSDILFSLQQTSDGGYILGGGSSSGVSSNKTAARLGETDCWVVKVDANGNRQWDQSYGNSDFQSIRILQQTSGRLYFRWQQDQAEFWRSGLLVGKSGCKWK